ncbi:hypothetical protein CEXT_573731 [Caerostris extrusa]|uniref:Uncharacterized protein n=1 Tax=Caerostris extrusa TaxID=172846 RepID=A0AAV4YFZ8_CAEEX|nr:hypothetical protein CEXT_573731 [Caerostris extrusa]
MSDIYEDPAILHSGNKEKTIQLSAEVQFVETKPSPKSLEKDNVITAKIKKHLKKRVLLLLNSEFKYCLTNCTIFNKSSLILTTYFLIQSPQT